MRKKTSFADHINSKTCFALFFTMLSLCWIEVLSAETFNEDRVRYILLDVSLGGPISYYRDRTNNTNVLESVTRWDAGVRVNNADNFERKMVENAWTITFKGTDQRAHGLAAFLTTEDYNEDRVRYILLDVSLGGPISYYRDRTSNPNVLEAVTRWDAGVRVNNADNFERKMVNNAWTITFKGTDQRAHGVAAFLTTEDYNEDRVRYILLDVSLGGPISYYRDRTSNPNVLEAVTRWDAGVKVINIDNFERKMVDNAWLITFIGTNQRAHGMAAFLEGWPLPTRVAVESETLPEEYVLRQNYPNPFNPGTTIEFSLPKSTEVTLKLYNLLGEEVMTILSKKLLNHGIHRLSVMPNHLVSGVYLYKIDTAEFSQVRRMTLIR